MLKQLGRLLLGSGLIMLFVGCRSITSSGNTNNSGTITAGPVNIATDHTVYAPTDRIQVTITNNLSGDIYALDTRASCTILELEQQSGDAWQGSTAARCPLGRVALPVKIVTGHVYTATIQAGYPGLSKAALPAGTYRLVLTYSNSPAGLASAASSTTIYSATLTVSGQVPSDTPTFPIGTPASGTPIP